MIIDEKPESTMDWFSFTVTHRQWKFELFHSALLSADIALLPPFPGPMSGLKSDNKKATALWAGLPVTDGFDYFLLRDLVDSADKRREAGIKGRGIAESQYDIRQSVRE